jgi:hypothetical protein
MYYMYAKLVHQSSQIVSTTKCHLYYQHNLTAIGVLKWELPDIMGPSVGIGSRMPENDKAVPSTSPGEERTPQKWWQKCEHGSLGSRNGKSF